MTDVRLVLFDVDGTLLHGGGAGRRAIHRALREVFGTIGPEGYWFDGKTDPQIVRELMSLAGIGDAVVAEKMSTLLERYVELLEVELARPDCGVRALEGVHELLDALEPRGDVVLGLLTGNLEAGARAKLRAAGIEPERFRANAYGSDHADRPELPAVAQRRAREIGADIPGHRIVVIGDTPMDIACGRALGARAIGVATGRYSVEELATHDPADVLPDLRDTDAALASILG